MPPASLPARAAALLLAVLLGTLLLPAPALAHLRLVGSTPAAGAELTGAPGSLRLVFSQQVQLPLARISLLGPQGEVELAPASAAPDSGQVLVAAVPGPLPAGEYRVLWQAAGPDGHPIRGEYSFRIAQTADEPGSADPVPADPAAAPSGPQPTTAPGAGGAEPAALGVGSPLFAVVRWLGFLGLLGLIGAVAFRSVVLPRAAREHPLLAESAGRGAAGVGALAAALLLLAAGLRLWAQAAAAGLAAPGAVRDLLLGTPWGWGWLLQVAAALTALLGLLAVRAGRAGGWAAAAGALVAAFTPALAGHAAAAERPALAVLADGLHVLGAGGWLGTLLLVVAVGIPAALRGPDGVAGVRHLVHAFSPAALAFAALVVATGALSAWSHLGGLDALWSSDYGRVLLLKLLAFSVVLAAGAYNWLRVRPSLGGPAATRTLRRTAGAELAAAVLVLAVTAALVATPPPVERSAGDAPPRGGPATSVVGQRSPIVPGPATDDR